MLNSKGQVAVIFVIFLPILFFMLGLIIDFSLLSYQKVKIENNIKSSLKYYLKNYEDENIDEKVKDLLNRNLDDLSINISNDSNEIKISAILHYEGIFKKITSQDISISYIGDIESKKIKKG